MLTRPRWLLHAEGAAVFAATLAFYAHWHFHWWLFAVLILVPDVFMIGYAINLKLGAALYNLVHTAEVQLSSYFWPPFCRHHNSRLTD